MYQPLSEKLQGAVAPLLGMSLRRMLGMEASTRETMINSGIPW